MVTLRSTFIRRFNYQEPKTKLSLTTMNRSLSMITQCRHGHRPIMGEARKARVLHVGA
jgi:hypothetical protein